MKLITHTNTNVTTIKNLLVLDINTSTKSVANSMLKLQPAAVSTTYWEMLRDEVVLNSESGKISLEGILYPGSTGNYLMFGIWVAYADQLSFIGMQRKNTGSIYEVDFAEIDFLAAAPTEKGLNYDDGVVGRFGRYSLNYELIGSLNTDGTVSWSLQEELYVDGVLQEFSVGPAANWDLGTGAKPLILGPGLVLFSGATNDSYIQISKFFTARGRIKRESGDFE